MRDSDLLVVASHFAVGVSASAIDQMTSLLESDVDAGVSILAAPAVTYSQLLRDSDVKVVMNCKNWVLYMSRGAVPFQGSIKQEHSPEPTALVWLGWAAYRRDVGIHLALLSPGPLEATESIELLRALEYGYRVIAAVVNSPPDSLPAASPL